MSQSDGKLPNLGKYSIRTEESSDDFQVGSFYKRQSLETNDSSSSSKQKYPDEKPVSTEKQVRPNKNESNTQKGPYKSNDSKIEDKPATKDAKIRALEDRFDDRHKKAKRESNKLSQSEPSPKDSPKPKIHLISDTTTSALKEDNDTHESVVVNLDPAAFVPDDTTDESSDKSNLKNTSQTESFILYTPNINKRKRKKVYPKRMPYDKIMSDVTFVLSGYENPRRSQLRDLALDMGALYKPFWDKSSCTHLICAFKNTPKYKEVMADSGRIVSERWIQECSSQRRLLDWRKFKLGDYPYPDSEEEYNVDEDLDYALNTSYKKQLPSR